MKGFVTDVINEVKDKAQCMDSGELHESRCYATKVADCKQTQTVNPPEHCESNHNQSCKIESSESDEEIIVDIFDRKSEPNDCFVTVTV